VERKVITSFVRPGRFFKAEYTEVGATGLKHTIQNSIANYLNNLTFDRHLDTRKRKAVFETLLFVSRKSRPVLLVLDIFTPP
jgi:hypothetical protein